MTETCACRWNYAIPAVTAVCGYHAASVTHTPRDGYTMPCPACAGDGCKACLHEGRAMVTLQAGKAAIRWASEQLPAIRERFAVDLLGGKIGRIPRRRRRS
jgi:hypothetical protein